MLCQMSRSEGMCARLNVLVSSRHNGPAFIAVSTSSMDEKAVPISAAAISVPDFGSRFNDVSLRLTGGTVARQLATRNRGGEIRSPDSTQALKQEHADSSCGIGRRSYGAIPFQPIRLRLFRSGERPVRIGFRSNVLASISSAYDQIYNDDKVSSCERHN